MNDFDVDIRKQNLDVKTVSNFTLGPCPVTTNDCEDDDDPTPTINPTRDLLCPF